MYRNIHIYLNIVRAEFGVYFNSAEEYYEQFFQETDVITHGAPYQNI